MENLKCGDVYNATMSFLILTDISISCIYDYNPTSNQLSAVVRNT